MMGLQFHLLWNLQKTEVKSCIMIVHSRENETKKRQKLVIFAPKFDNVKF